MSLANRLPEFEARAQRDPSWFTAVADCLDGMRSAYAVGCTFSIMAHGSLSHCFDPGGKVQARKLNKDVAAVFYRCDTMTQHMDMRRAKDKIKLVAQQDSKDAKKLAKQFARAQAIEGQDVDMAIADAEGPPAKKARSGPLLADILASAAQDHFAQVVGTNELLSFRIPTAVAPRTFILTSLS